MEKIEFLSQVSLLQSVNLTLKKCNSFLLMLASHGPPGLILKYKTASKKGSTLVEPDQVESFLNQYHTLLRSKFVNLKKKVRKSKAAGKELS